MPRTPKFTESHVRKARVGQTRVFDTPNLYLYVTPKGVKRYFYRYTVPRQGRVTETSVGKPGISLNKAKAIAAKYRELLNDGIDPQEAKQWKQREEKTFGQLADEFIEDNKPRWGESRLREAKLLLHVHGKPLTNLRLAQVQAAVVKKTIAPLLKSAPHQARRTLSMWEQVMHRAKVLGMHAGLNPASWEETQKHLHARQPKIEPNHFDAMPYQQIPEFLRELRTHRGTAAMALEFLILTATRTSEVLNAQWSEFDLGGAFCANWVIPASRMKARNPHRVPLSERAVELLKRQQERSGKCGNMVTFDNSKYRACAVFDSEFVFTGYKRHQALVGRSMYRLLCDMGIKVTVHGFRSSFRDWCADHKANFDFAAVEMCLAHTVGSTTVRSYLHTDLFEKRRTIMEEWSKFCG